MTDDVELAAIRTAYAAIKGLNRAQWTRVLTYLETRMAEDDRGSHIGRDELPPPVQYVAAGVIDEPYDTPEEAMREHGDGTVVEINGIAVVSQRFAIEVPCDDDYIVEWFDTRDTAEAYLASMGR